MSSSFSTGTHVNWGWGEAHNRIPNELRSNRCCCWCLCTTINARASRVVLGLCWVGPQSPLVQQRNGLVSCTEEGIQGQRNGAQLKPQREMCVQERVVAASCSEKTKCVACCCRRQVCGCGNQSPPNVGGSCRMGRVRPQLLSLCATQWTLHTLIPPPLQSPPLARDGLGGGGDCKGISWETVVPSTDASKENR